MLNVQNNGDVTEEYSQDEDLIQKDEGSQDVRIVLEDIKKEEDGQEEDGKKEFGQEDLNKEGSKEMKMVQKEEDAKEDAPEMEAAQEEEDTQEKRFSKGRRWKATCKGGHNTRGGR